MATWMMETVYIPQDGTPPEPRAALDPPPLDPLPPYARVRFPSEAAIDAPTTIQRGPGGYGVTRPECLFHKQVWRQVKRLDYQSVRELQGRKQTLPFDSTCDFLANAENNVFRSWAAAGICPPEWGTPWPSGTERWSRKALPGGPRIGARWPHEEYTEPVHGLDLAASRPSRLFELQWEEEFQWHRDEAEFWGREIDENQLRQESFLTLKELWVEDKLWNLRWSEFPGDRWMHEDSEDEMEENAAPGAVSPPPPYAELFGPEPDTEAPSQRSPAAENGVPSFAGTRSHVSDNLKSAGQSEENISRHVATTSSRHVLPRTRRTRTTELAAQAAPRRSARIAALNEARGSTASPPASATTGISKTSRRAEKRVCPFRTQRTRRR